MSNPASIQPLRLALLALMLLVCFALSVAVMRAGNDGRSVGVSGFLGALLLGLAWAYTHLP